MVDLYDHESLKEKEEGKKRGEEDRPGGPKEMGEGRTIEEHISGGRRRR